MKPLHDKIQLDIEEITHMGESTGAIKEQGTIVSIGDYVDEEEFPIGATLYFKAWAIDMITDGDNKYYYIDVHSDALCGIKLK